jgi:hypothetical protein
VRQGYSRARVPFNLIGFRFEFGGHLAEGLARIVISRDSGELAALFGTHTETLGLGAHARRTTVDLCRSQPL